MKYFLLLVGMFIFTNCILGQKKDSTWVGSINGSIRDSVYNFDLQSATLTIYRQSDTSLISYGLSDNFGVFHLKDLPLNLPLHLVASSMGYKTKFIKIILRPDNKSVELSTINLDRTDTTTLEDVVVKSVAPIRMNGDTLEFNADAFHLDKNAVVDDLLRNIPNVTVWGDGSITVNGKEISSLKVDGKPYMGGDSKLALQNIAKDAVDKIQVYRVSHDETNRYDSTTEINIKIKENKKHSAYGKIGGGMGTDHRYQADGSYSIIDKKTQIGISGNANNVNETPNSVAALLREGSFGGVNAISEYQPNFSTPGLNKYYGGGAMIQHDFQDNPTNDKTQRITGNYFVNKTIGDQSSRTNTLSLLLGDSSQNSYAESKNYSNTLRHNLQGTFLNQKPKNTLNINVDGSITKTTTNNENETTVENQNNEIINKNSTNSNTESNGKNMSLAVGFNKTRSGWISDYSKRFPSDYNLNYNLSAGEENSTQIQKTIFDSHLDPTQNRRVDRNYNNHTSSMTHTLDGSWGNFIPWIFGQRNFFGNMVLKLNNNLIVTTNKLNNYVTDWDSTTNVFNENSYLTNNGRYTTIQERFGVEISKYLYKSSANRYMKSANISITPNWQLYHQKNSSIHEFQNFSRNYNNFVPSIQLNFSNYQFGAFSENLGFQYSESINIPNVDQLRPLVDSANITYLSLGNPNLKSSKMQNFSMNFSHYDQHNGRNAMNFSLGLSYNRTLNAFIDNTNTDSLGRTTHYVINGNGTNSFGGNGNFNKSLKIAKLHQIQIQFDFSDRVTKSPNIVNTIWNKSSMFQSNNDLSINYTFKGIWSTNLKQSYNYYRSKQTGLSESSFSNKQMVTSFSSSIKPITKWMIGTNINFNRVVSAAAPASNFTIWNAYTSYRCMKGNNLEFKFSAMDILHQNRTFFNSGNNNTITQQWTNTLQQYFMLSISYFPRKFGKKEKSAITEMNVN